MTQEKILLNPTGYETTNSFQLSNYEVLTLGSGVIFTPNHSTRTSFLVFSMNYHLANEPRDHVFQKDRLKLTLDSLYPDFKYIEAKPFLRYRRSTPNYLPQEVLSEIEVSWKHEDSPLLSLDLSFKTHVPDLEDLKYVKHHANIFEKIIEPYNHPDPEWWMPSLELAQTIINQS